MSYIFIIICFLYGLCAVYFAKKNDYTKVPPDKKTSWGKRETV